MQYQPVFDIAALCVRKHITDVVLCPGSRCAPLTLAFTRHPSLKTRTFSDERSAGFIGLGMAQQTRRPVVLVCTSGTAAYNFAPAVAEAFFSQTPLIVFTADRPSEWIGQHDGQTIFQPAIFGKHAKASFDLPQDYDHPDSIWAINRIVNDAINLSQQDPKGPVHINTPFREPLYPAKEDKPQYNRDVRVISARKGMASPSPEDLSHIKDGLESAAKILIVIGQQDRNPKTIEALSRLSAAGIPVVGDIVSNIHGVADLIRHSDLMLGQASERVREELQPDLLITAGKSLVSKNLKLFLRKFPARRHWHIQPAGTAADTFKNLTDVFHLDPETFFSLPQPGPALISARQKYRQRWRDLEEKAAAAIRGFFPHTQLSELEVVREILIALPEGYDVHLANSMSVRYANFFGMQAQQPVEVFANRGTSGIDGSVSTAVGHALTSDRKQLLITGDVGFFYDRNAFWHNYRLDNLKILLLNNHGGLIFNMIDGPASQPEAPEYFITRQKLTAAALCAEFGFRHLRLSGRESIKKSVKDFFESAGTTILEVETDIAANRAVFDEFKTTIKTTL